MREDMAREIERLAGLVEQLSEMDVPLPETLAVGILVESVEVNALMSMISWIKTFTDQYVTWEDVSSRSIEEATTLRFGTGSIERSSAAHRYCEICGRTNHATPKCFLNPLYAEKCFLSTRTWSKEL